MITSTLVPARTYGLRQWSNIISDIEAVWVLQLIGHIEVPGQAWIGSLIPIISDKAGLMMNGMKLDLVEEIKPDMCELLLVDRTVSEVGLGNGDILVAVCRRAGDPLPQVSMHI